MADGQIINVEVISLMKAMWEAPELPTGIVDALADYMNMDVDDASPMVIPLDLSQFQVEG